VTTKAPSYSLTLALVAQKNPRKDTPQKKIKKSQKEQPNPIQTNQMEGIKVRKIHLSFSARDVKAADLFSLPNCLIALFQLELDHSWTQIARTECVLDYSHPYFTRPIPLYYYPDLTPHYPQKYRAVVYDSRNSIDIEIKNLKFLGQVEFNLRELLFPPEETQPNPKQSNIKISKLLNEHNEPLKYGTITVKATPLIDDLRSLIPIFPNHSRPEIIDPQRTTSIDIITAAPTKRRPSLQNIQTVLLQPLQPITTVSSPGNGPCSEVNNNTAKRRSSVQLGLGDNPQINLSRRLSTSNQVNLKSDNCSSANQINPPQVPSLLTQSNSQTNLMSTTTLPQLNITAPFGPQSSNPSTLSLPEKALVQIEFQGIETNENLFLQVLKIDEPVAIYQSTVLSLSHPSYYPSTTDEFKPTHRRKESMGSRELSRSPSGKLRGSPSLDSPRYVSQSHNPHKMIQFAPFQLDLAALRKKTPTVDDDMKLAPVRPKKLLSFAISTSRSLKMPEFTDSIFSPPPPEAEAEAETGNQAAHGDKNQVGKFPSLLPTDDVIINEQGSSPVLPTHGEENEKDENVPKFFDLNFDKNLAKAQKIQNQTKLSKQNSESISLSKQNSSNSVLSKQNSATKPLHSRTVSTTSLQLSDNDENQDCVLRLTRFKGQNTHQLHIYAQIRIPISTFYKSSHKSEPISPINPLEFTLFNRHQSRQKGKLLISHLDPNYNYSFNDFITTESISPQLSLAIDFSGQGSKGFNTLNSGHFLKKKTPVKVHITGGNNNNTHNTSSSKDILQSERDGGMYSPTFVEPIDDSDLDDLDPDNMDWSQNQFVHALEHVVRPLLTNLLVSESNPIRTFGFGGKYDNGDFINEPYRAFPLSLEDNIPFAKNISHLIQQYKEARLSCEPGSISHDVSGCLAEALSAISSSVPLYDMSGIHSTDLHTNQTTNTKCFGKCPPLPIKCKSNSNENGSYHGVHKCDKHGSYLNDHNPQHGDDHVRITIPSQLFQSNEPNDVSSPSIVSYSVNSMMRRNSQPHMLRQPAHVCNGHHPAYHILMVLTDQPNTWGNTKYIIDTLHRYTTVLQLPVSVIVVSLKTLKIKHFSAFDKINPYLSPLPLIHYPIISYLSKHRSESDGGFFGSIIGDDSAASDSAEPDFLIPDTFNVINWRPHRNMVLEIWDIISDQAMRYYARTKSVPRQLLPHYLSMMEQKRHPSLMPKTTQSFVIGANMNQLGGSFGQTSRAGGGNKPRDDNCTPIVRSLDVLHANKHHNHDTLFETVSNDGNSNGGNSNSYSTEISNQTKREHSITPSHSSTSCSIRSHANVIEMDGLISAKSQQKIQNTQPSPPVSSSSSATLDSKNSIEQTVSSKVYVIDNENKSQTQTTKPQNLLYTPLQEHQKISPPHPRPFSTPPSRAAHFQDQTNTNQPGSETLPKRKMALNPLHIPNVFDASFPSSSDISGSGLFRIVSDDGFRLSSFELPSSSSNSLHSPGNERNSTNGVNGNQSSRSLGGLKEIVEDEKK